MSDINTRIDQLSPARRRLLEVLLEKTAKGSKKEVIARRKEVSECRLSFDQERLWFLDQLEPDTSLYNMPAALRMKGQLNVEALDLALNEIVRRHEVLRTSFPTRQGSPVQVIAPSRRTRLPILDLSHLREEERESVARRLSLDEARRPFNLATGPLLRVTLMRMKEHEHLLLFALHHIAFDGGSAVILIRELGLLYGVFCDGNPSPMPELEIQYGDYAEWQRERMESEEARSQLEYWKEELKGIEVLQMPTDRARGGVRRHEGGRVGIRIGREVSERLKEESVREGVTMYMMMMGGFEVLVYRNSWQEEIGIGTPIANRRRVEMEGMIGFFVNTLVIRGDVRGEERYGELLRRVRERMLRAYENQDIPFEKVVEEIRPEREMSVTPLFQVMFVYQNTPGREKKIGELEVEEIEVETGAAKFEMTMTMEEKGGEIVGRLEYREDLYDRETAERLAREYEKIMEGVARRGVGEKIWEMRVIGEEEERQIRESGRGRRNEREGKERIIELIEGEAERRGDAIAVESGGERISYEEMNRRGNQIGRYLRRRGVGPEVMVGICMERSVDLIVGMVGILKAGGAYVPMEVSYPKERLGLIMRDGGVGVVVTQERVKGELPENGAEVISVDGEWGEIGRESERNIERAGDGENLAYVMYTSGSSGRPKGVMIREKSVLNLVRGLREEVYEKGREVERISVNGSIAFDTSVKQLMQLVEGRTLHVIAEEVRVDGEAMLESIEREGIEVLDCTPTVLEGLIREGLLEEGRRYPAKVLVGGEAIDEELWREIGDSKGGMEFYNVYGPTECTVDTTVRRIEGRGKARIGRSLNNIETYILDDHMQVVPVGVAGELYIGGEGLGRGYIGRAEMTAERFMPNEYGGEGKRMYRTGDICRYDREGEIEYIGRRDEQVKVRGYRIELGEIEVVLKEHEKVRGAVAAVREVGEGREKMVVGYVVMEEGEGGREEELKRYMRGRVPEYMVPVRIVEVEEIPLNGNGKVERRRLPEVEREKREGGEAKGMVEEIVGVIWEEVLGVEGIGREDNFFELGGHSLIGTQMISRVREAMGVEIELRAVFERPTVRGIGERVEELRRGGKKIEGERIRRRERGRGGEIRLSYGQERIWFLEELEGGSAFYNMAGGVRVRGELDEEALERSVRKVERRHEILRTVIEERGGRVVQVVREEGGVEIRKIDVSGEEGEEKRRRVEEIVREEGRRGFELSRGPLMRVVVIKEGEGEHVVEVVMHHIISDGWSVGILVRELGEIYGREVRGEEGELEELEIQYGDYAEWQRERMESEEARSQLEYWKEELKGIEVLQMPTDRARGGVRRHEGGRVGIRIGREVSERLKEESVREGVTMYMMMMGGFEVLVYRNSWQEEIGIGTPIANRRRVEMEGMIGFFVNTLVIRGDVRGEERYGELLRRVRERMLRAYENQDIPFEKVVEEIRPEREMSVTPLFQVMFVYQNTPGREKKIGELEVEEIEVETGAAKFEMTMTMEEKGGEIVGRLEYREDLYDRETAERLAREYEKIMEGVARRGVGEKIWEMRVIGEEEERQIRESGRGRRNEREGKERIIELIEGEAERRGDAIAVESGGERISYEEMNRRGNQIGRYLRRRGVGPEVMVGICMERSVDLIVGMVGILKAGGAYVPIDPNYPIERIEFILNDTKAGVVISRGESVAKLGDHKAEIIELDKEWDEISKESGEQVITAAVPEDLAYVIYTSGSTGRPKGVGIVHRSAVALVDWAREIYGEAEMRGVLASTSVCFDLSVFEIFVTLCSGGKVILVKDALSLIDSDEGEEVTLINTVPSAITELVRLRGVPETVKTVNLAGEPLKKQTVDELYENSKVEKVYNLYGPSEDTTYTTYAVVGKGNEKKIMIGRPINNTEVYILDDHMQVVPVGVAGELYIGGEGLGRGYIGRAEVTAERFMPNEYGGEGKRMYRTGDICRYDREGEIEYIGRRDEQVKVRGYRIELGEIEVVLKEHEKVRGAVAAVREVGEGREKMVVGYVVMEEGEGGREEELKRYMRGRVPEYMVPVRIVEVEEIPLNGNGKVERRRLPEVEREKREGGEAKGMVEEIVGVIWEEVLGVEGIGREDNFFELGGHSLIGTQMISRVREAMGVEIELRAVFERPTVRGIGERVEELRRGGKKIEGERIRRRERGRGGEIRLSYGQERIWFLEELEGGSALYNMAGGVRVRGELDEEALERSVRKVERRHEILRTVIEERGGRVVQVVREEGGVEIRKIDVSGEEGEEKRRRVEEIVREEGRRGFELSRGPLMRVVVIKEGEGEHVVEVVMHHIISDGWSVGILVRELGEIYGREVRGEEGELEELEIQYGDYAEWQRERMESEEVRSQLEYWKEELKGIEVLQLPTDRVRPAVLSYSGAREKMHLSRDLSDKVKRASQQQGLTVFMQLLSIFKALMHRYSGQDQIAIGTPIANRERTEIESLIGFFVNTIVLKTDLRGNPTFSSLGRQVREVALGAYTHQEVPFEWLVDELQPERSLSHTPLFQVAFTLENEGAYDLELENLTLGALDLHSGTVKFDLVLYATETPQGLELRFEYATDLFDTETIRRMAGHYENLLGQAVTNVETRIGDLSFLGEPEQNQMLYEWNDTRHEYSTDKCLHEIVEMQAERTPEAIAVEFEGQVVTYRELNNRANRLANYIIEIGVCQGAHIGICLDRSIDMIVSVLGVLKAGATYVPVDTSWPLERIHWILFSLNVGCVLTQYARLRQLHDIQWRLPDLTTLICLDIDTASPPPETVDVVAQRELWDEVAKRSTDRIAAGGFISSYTGSRFSMSEVDEYIERVVGLARPFLGPDKRILEIGCGAGLIMFEIVPLVSRYVALDPSTVTQSRNLEVAIERDLSNLDLITGFAAEIGSLQPESFDLIIVSRTVQFFPGPIYLKSVVREAVRLLVPGGAILLADIMDARAKEDFRTSLVEYKDKNPEAHTKTQLDGELYVDRSFFADLKYEIGEIECVEILDRNDGFENELRYRYDVIINKRVHQERPCQVPVSLEHGTRIFTDWHVGQAADANPVVRVTSNDFAYIIFTSGSTGTPKGVAVRHRPAVNIIEWVNSTHNVRTGDRLLFVTSLCFDLSVYDIFGVLSAGGTIRVASRSDLRDPKHLVDILCTEGITFWDSAPSALQHLAPFFPSDKGVSEGTCLRLVFLSGDWIPLPLPDQVRGAFPSARVISLGGATEATVWSNWYPVNEVDPAWASIPYGKPTWNAGYYVLNRQLSPCPIRVSGDLYIGGECLSTGYINEPGITAEKYVPDPFGNEPGARLYKTGDLARYLLDGNIEFLGRKDQQVKIRGFRIELGEIEAVLSQHPSVRDAVVLVRQDMGADRQLVGYVVARNGLMVDTAQLREFLKKRLPEYMVPVHYVMLDKMPLTSNGKLDRQALPAPEDNSADSARSVALPRTPVEEVLSGIWANLLGLEEVRIDDNLFDLGAHSLMATQVISQIRGLLDIELPLRRLFEAPTVGGIAEHIEELSRDRSGLLAPPLVPIDRSIPIPLSLAQQRLWLLDQMSPGSAFYNIPFVFSVRGQLNVATLEQAIREIVRRHEILRTTITASNGQPIQNIKMHVEFGLPLVDLSGLDAFECEAAAERVLTNAAREPFDLTVGPLLRATLILMGQWEYLFSLTIHHIVCDDWSLRILIRELQVLYRSFGEGAGSALPEVTIQYADFAHWQRQWMKGQVLDGQLSFWTGQLAELTEFRLKAGPSREVKSNHPGRHQPFKYPQRLSTSLRELNRQNGVTMYMTLLAAFGTLLYRYTGRSDIAIGSPIANRNRSETEGVIGFFVNELIIRLDLSGNPTFRDLLNRVRRVTLAAYDHQDVSFEDVVAALRPDRTLSKAPLVQVHFDLHTDEMPQLELDGVEITPRLVERGAVQFDLQIAVRDMRSGLSGLLGYNTELFDEPTMAALLDEYRTLLEEIVANPEIRLLDIAIRPEAESAVAAGAATAPVSDEAEQFHF